MKTKRATKKRQAIAYQGYSLAPGYQGYLLAPGYDYKYTAVADPTCGRPGMYTLFEEDIEKETCKIVGRELEISLIRQLWPHVKFRPIKAG